MQPVFRLAATALVATLSLSPSFASAADESGDDLVVGAGALVYRSPFKGEGVSVFPIPIVVARRGAAYIDGLEAGVTYAPAPNGDYAFSVDAFVAARALPGESREQITADLGVRASLAAPAGTVSVDYRRDVTGEFDGGEAVFRYEFTVPVGRVLVTPGLQAAWQDRATADHMYGVSADQRRKMIDDGAKVVPALFDVREGGVNLGADLTVLWPVSDRIVAVAQVGGAYLGDSVRENPGLRDDFEVQALIGVGYRF
jgi:outer membrane protein